MQRREEILKISDGRLDRGALGRAVLNREPLAFHTDDTRTALLGEACTISRLLPPSLPLDAVVAMLK